MGRPTIADLAREAGVGVATVDRVINRRARVKADTAQRVLEAAEAIGFRASGMIRRRLEEGGAERKLGFILQKRTTPFYGILADALGEATRSSPAMRARRVVEFLDELTPRSVVEKLHQLGSKVDVLAVVAADHPHVSQAIDQLHAKGVPTFTLLSDLTAPKRAGFIGIDNRKVGRTAAWSIARLSKGPGKVGILMGSHRYLCQELCEISFRSYFRENAPDFQVVETLVSLEDPSLAQAATLELLKRHPDLVGIFVDGGGIEGVIEALRDDSSPKSIITICLELTEQTRAALIDGIVDVVISHPRAALAERAVEVMVRALEDRAGDGLSQILLPFDIFISENV